MAKLYPPIIPGTLPAFYTTTENGNNGTETKITVPFSMNKAVSSENIDGFALKLKTAYSNTLIDVLKKIDNNLDLASKEITFFLTDNSTLSKIKPGQFLKAQLAYINTDNNTETIGYYSTVGVIKYTDKPEISIENLSLESTNNFQNTYIGKYKSNDVSEKHYLYKFSIYKLNNGKKEELVDTSDWLLHDNSNEEDFYSFNNEIEDTETYGLEYTVKTINGLEESTELYQCQNNSQRDSYLNEIFTLSVENNYEDGYNLIKLIKKDINNIYITDTSTISWGNSDVEKEIVNKYKKNQDDIISDWSGGSNPYYTLSEKLENNSQKKYRTIKYTYQKIARSDESTDFYLYKYQVISEDGYDKTNDGIYYVFPAPLEINLYRKNNFSQKSVKINNYKFQPENQLQVFYWNFKDFTIEQGVEYTYYIKEIINKDCLKKYNTVNEEIITYSNLSNKIESNLIYSDFEDMFLWDGKQQIKIRFNPKVSSFKINHLEQKTDVIGNRYPVFFRNNIVEYKEFPISGLISYHLDDNELFIQDSLQELGIKIKDILERQNNPAGDFNYPTSSLNLISNNIKAERLFKLKLLDWLGNGEIKLFKSPSEGNYFVRLMNISLSPEDKLNRMLHTFSCTAYEAKEFNFENLKELGFINQESGDSQ